MASKLYNLVRFVTSTVGTGTTIAVGAAVSGFLTPAQAGISNGDVVDLAFKDGSNSQIGTATYSTSGPQFTGLSVTKSTNSNSPISLSGTAEVFISPRAETLSDASHLTSGTLAIARLNGGTANQVAQGDGSFIQNTRKLLNTLTASASASLDDTSSFGNTAFNDFEIVLDNIVLASASQDLRLQVRSGGTFQTTSYLAGVLSYNGGGPSTAAQNSTVCIPLTVTGGNTSTSYGINGTVRVYNVQQTSTVKMWDGKVVHLNAANSAVMMGMSGGWWNSSAALDGFRLISSSGNLTSGTMKVYGL